MILPANRFSAIALAPLAIILVVFMMVFSTHSSANATPSPAASENAAPNASPDPQGGPIISCSSDNMRRNYCAADVRGGVQLIKQRSDAPCIFNRTWGFINGRGIWVDRGCRADFSIPRPHWGGRG